MSYDLSSLQPENGFAQPKLKLKFSSNDKQIIQKEWTQKLFLQGKKQIPTLRYENKSGRKIGFPTGPLIYDSFGTGRLPKVPVEVSIPDDLGLSAQFETRIEAISLDWSSGAHNNTWSPTLTVPNQAVASQNSQDIVLNIPYSSTIASQLFYRLKKDKDKTWISTPIFTDYYYTLNKDNKSDFKVESSRILIKKGKKLTLSYTMPSGYTNTLVRGTIYTLILNDGRSFLFYIVPKDGKGSWSAPQRAAAEQYISSLTYESENIPLNENKKYTISFNFKDNIKELISLAIEIRVEGGDIPIDTISTDTAIKLLTDTN